MNELDCFCWIFRLLLTFGTQGTECWNGRLRYSHLDSEGRCADRGAEHQSYPAYACIQAACRILS